MAEMSCSHLNRINKIVRKRMKKEMFEAVVKWESVYKEMLNSSLSMTSLLIFYDLRMCIFHYIYQGLLNDGDNIIK